MNLVMVINQPYLKVCFVNEILIIMIILYYFTIIQSQKKPMNLVMVINQPYLNVI